MRSAIVGKLVGVLMSVSALGFSSSQASTLTVINFDGLEAAPFWATGIASSASQRLSTQLLSAYGVSFTSGDSWVTVVDLGVGHATSGRNGIAGSRDGGLLTYEGAYPIRMEFFNPTATSEMATTDFVSVRGDNFGEGSLVYLRAYDVLGHLIAQVSTPDLGGPLLQIAAPGIHAVEFVGTHDLGGVGMDDLTFDTLQFTVPEPSGVTLFLVSLGAFGFAARRENRKA